MKFKIVSDPDEANSNDVRVTLFRCTAGLVRGWFIGPVTKNGDSIQMPYVARSENMLGIISLLKASIAAKDTGANCTIIDPDGLWPGLSEDAQI